MKSPTHLERCIICPKCQSKTMRKALGKNPVAEYFDDRCHSYFTIEELVHIWGYDLGDFGDCDLATTAHIYNIVLDKHSAEIEYAEAGWAANLQVIEDKIVATTWFDFDSVSSFVVDEPTFKSPSERLEAYEMVDRMFIGIPEWSMEDNSVDTGAQHV